MSDETPAPGCKVLTQEQVDHFINRGYVVIDDCFDEAHADWMMKGIWERMGVDPNDKSTWTKGKYHNKNGRYHMPAHRVVKIDDFSPKAYWAMNDLAGGEGKYVDETYRWYDNPIVSLGCDEDESYPGGAPPADFGWHIDGGSFTHFLDAPEVAMLVVPIYSKEVKSNGGATWIAPDSIPLICKYLQEHPEGVDRIDFVSIMKQCKDFVELTAKQGQVVLVHNLCCHTGSPNALRIPRFMANPCMSLKEPMKFDKPKDQLNIIERATLRAMGVESYTFEIKGERKQYTTSNRYKTWEEMRAYELEELKKIGKAEDFTIPYEILTNPNIVTL
jgi:hypothetical protein